MSVPTVMPFGKHKGRLLSDIPATYLEWCLTNLEDLSDDLSWSITCEIETRRLKSRARPNGGRSYSAPPPTSNLPVAVNADLAVLIIREGRRALASKYHPDRPGGNSELMTQTNATCDYLEKRVNEVLGVGGVRA